MRTRFPYGLRVLRQDERGASIIEFALFLPVLALMVAGISDVAMGYSTKLNLEAAAYRALEKVVLSRGQTDFALLRAEAAAEAGVPVTAVTTDNWLECDRAREADVNGACDPGEEVGRYVEVQIDTNYAPHFDFGPLADAVGGANGVVPISATAAVRIQ